MTMKRTGLAIRASIHMDARPCTTMVTAAMHGAPRTTVRTVAPDTTAHTTRRPASTHAAAMPPDPTAPPATGRRTTHGPTPTARTPPAQADTARGVPAPFRGVIKP